VKDFKFLRNLKLRLDLLNRIGRKSNKMDQINEIMTNFNRNINTINSTQQINDNERLKLINTITNGCVVAVLLVIGEEYQAKNIPNPISPQTIIDLFFHNKKLQKLKDL
jgi:hypothetical protein